MEIATGVDFGEIAKVADVIHEILARLPKVYELRVSVAFDRIVREHPEYALWMGDRTDIFRLGSVKMVRACIRDSDLDGAALIEACKGNRDVVAELLMLGSKTTTTSFDLCKNPELCQGRHVNTFVVEHALAVACEYGHIDIISHLLRTGVTKISMSCAMSHAISLGRVDIVKMLVEAGSPIGYLYQHKLAADGDHIGVLKYLLSTGERLSRFTNVMYRAVEVNRTDIIEFLADTGLQFRPISQEMLLHAAERGNPVIVKWICERINVHMDGPYALHIAIHHNHTEIIKYLRDLGVQLDDQLTRDAASWVGLRRPSAHPSTKK